MDLYRFGLLFADHQLKLHALNNDVDPRTETYQHILKMMCNDGSIHCDFKYSYYLIALGADDIAIAMSQVSNDRASSTTGQSVGRIGSALKDAQACEAGTCGIPGQSCFVADTMIRTENGDTAIQNIKVGDRVWSKNLQTGADELQPVAETYIRSTDTLVQLWIDGAMITTTPEHPFMLYKRGWVQVGHLQPGDTLTTPTGLRALQKITTEPTTTTVYNFKVTTNHNYYGYAGNTPVIVHNNGYRDSLHGKVRRAERPLQHDEQKVLENGTIYIQAEDGAIVRSLANGDGTHTVIIKDPGTQKIVTRILNLTDAQLERKPETGRWF